MLRCGSALSVTKSRLPQPLIFFAKFGFDFFTLEIATGAVFLDSADGARNARCFITLCRFLDRKVRGGETPRKAHFTNVILERTSTFTP